MAKRPAVVSSDLTPDWLERRDRMIAELCNQTRRSVTDLGKGLSLHQLQQVLEHQNPFTTPDTKAGEWQEFYQDVFGWDTDFSNLQIPPERDGFGWLIVVTKGLTINLVFDKLTERTKTWRYTNDLDKAVTENDREPNTDYCLWIRDRVEADEKNKNLSANQLKDRGHKGITLLERLLLELVYFLTTENHLDVKNWTLCSGSRSQDGNVPFVLWHLGNAKVGVSWCNAGSRDDNLRTRSVVSLSS